MPSDHPSLARYETITVAGPQAPWITMVHGVSQNRQLFSRQIEAFKADYQVILIDLPGHGLSSDIPGPYGLEEYASSIEGALNHAQVTQSHFWGTHLGAGTGLLLGCRQPEIFRSLILEGPVFPGRPLPSVNDTLADIATTAREKGIAAAREKWWQDGEWFDVMRANPKECRAAEHRALIGEFGGQPWLDSGLASRPLPPIDTLLVELEIPVLIVNGEHEVPDFLDAADALEAALPNCRRATIPNAGGFPLWEFPARVNAKVRSFLEHG
ncbi:MAG: alpha/beta fold hydrolase [Alphaproteobacteria bacterium]|nr:alpha/beta fold hydrolase [Alphaproteobacteria bacterium]